MLRTNFTIEDLIPEYEEDLNKGYLLVKGDKIIRRFPNGKIVDNRAYNKVTVGYGDKKTAYYMSAEGEGDSYDEYEHYKEFLQPLFDSKKFSEEELSNTHKYFSDGKDGIEFIERQIKYAEQHPDKVMQYNKVREDGLVFISESSYDKENYKKNYIKTLENLRVIRFMNNDYCFVDHYILSCKISKKAWEIVKHCFRYIDRDDSVENDDCDYFTGYEIMPGKINEVEEILNVKPEFRFDYIKAQAIKEKEQFEKEKYEWQRFINKLDIAFDNDCSDDISELIKRHEYIKLEGEEIPLDKQDIFGSGEWFTITDNSIWHVINNGNDGDDWSRNFISTGGAGAYGYKFKKTKERLELLNYLKEHYDYVKAYK